MGNKLSISSCDIPSLRSLCNFTFCCMVRLRFASNVDDIQKTFILDEMGV